MEKTHTEKSGKTTTKSQKILIVDDEQSIRNLLKQILEREGYDCELAENAEKAVILLSVKKFDLIISDVQMPGKSGIELLEEIKTLHPHLATLLISGHTDNQTAKSAILKGAIDFLVKPFQKNQVLISVANALRRRALDLQSQFEVQNLESIINDQTQDLLDANDRLNRILTNTVKAMSLALESRDPYTAGHQQRVASISAAIAQKMGFNDERIEYLKMAGMIHDIGKISVPAEILCKPTRLSKAEFEIIKEHPLTGYRILKEIDFPYPLAKMVYQHHERIDGSGYPQGLAGDQILMESKILAVTDVVEAMASHRPYRSALGIDVALDEIVKNKGRSFDPEVVETCCELFRNNEMTLN